MTSTGIVSDIDEDRLYGLIAADDGALLLFTLRDKPAHVRDRVEVGTRVQFIRNSSHRAARAVELVPLDGATENGLPAPAAPPLAR